jgi:hypothetical protein
VSAKTVRRRISDGVIAAHRIGRNIRVDATSVTRLLVPINDNGTDGAVPMQENNSELPQLHRQRGRDRNWTTIIGGIEISLDTSDAAEAKKKLRIVAQSKNHEASAPKTGRQRLGPWSVLQEKTRGFIILFYDENHRRKKHRIPTNLNPPVVTRADAEAYAQHWYQLHAAERLWKSYAPSNKSHRLRQNREVRQQYLAVQHSVKSRNVGQAGSWLWNFPTT